MEISEAEEIKNIHGDKVGQWEHFHLTGKIESKGYYKNNKKMASGYTIILLAKWLLKEIMPAGSNRLKTANGLIIMKMVNALLKAIIMNREDEMALGNIIMKMG